VQAAKTKAPISTANAKAIRASNNFAIKTPRHEVSFRSGWHHRMHRFAMDFAACLVKYGNTQVRFIVTTFFTEARREPLTMVDCFCIQRETLSKPIADRNAVMHIEKKVCKAIFSLLGNQCADNAPVPHKVVVRQDRYQRRSILTSESQKLDQVTCITDGPRGVTR
jgi:hypothetical protein